MFWTVTVLAAITTASAIANHGSGGSKTIPQPSRTTSPAFIVEAHNGAVAAEHILCSDIGVDILKQGGNAVDSAVAATLCSGVANMFSSGLGGGGFLTVRVRPGEVYTIDFREIAPAASNATMFGTDPNSSLIGGLGVGIPGELLALEEMHKRWGKLSWKKLVTPSVQLAKGFPIGPELGRRILAQQAMAPLLSTNPDWTPIFAPNGTLLQQGDTIRNLALSRTLATIAEHGADAFYKGPIAKSLVAKVRATGGIWTEKDLANYRVKVEKALHGTYRGLNVYTTHAPGSGPVLINLLNILEHYPFPKQGLTPLNFHRLIESMKFAFASRTRIGDPGFVNTTLLNQISTKRFAANETAFLTDNTTHSGDYYGPIQDIPRDHGTMHLCTVDKNRMVVSITSTINFPFGSQVLDPSTGVILNDELDDFNRPGIPNAGGLFPSPFDYAAPNKRPTSSISPTIIENPDGSFLFTVGAAGGTKIYTAIAQVILRTLNFGQNVSAAIEAPRAHHALFPNIVDLDNGFPQDLLDGLAQRGHNLSAHDINTLATSFVQAIKLEGNTLFAASDSRKNGIAAGY